MINPQNPDFTNTPAGPRRNPGSYRLAAGGSPVISIVTPFYNTGPVFEETARTIFGQSFQQFEWLIVNDGSTDPDALRLLDEYRRRDPRIRVIDHPENRGLSAARNSGVAQASCEYVLLLDSDDLLEPTAAEKWWWYLLTHPQAAFVASYHVAFGGLNYLWSGGFHDSAMNAERNRVSMLLMLRKSVHQAVGGFDETIRGGLEDWEFWMRCASRGIWGATIPEYLAWYRVRGDHSDRWENLQEERVAAFRETFQQKYPALYQGQFPALQAPVDFDLTLPDLDIPLVNRLEKTGPHLLIIMPWLVMGGAERFVLNVIDQLTARGWKISIVTTAPSENAWLYEFEQRTTDIFLLPNFLPIPDFPRFLGSLIQSRGFDAVFVQGSLEGYRLLPVLRAWFPDLPIFDYLHFVTPDWMQGGLPRLSLLAQDSLTHTATSCRQVRDWMAAQGAGPARLSVCIYGVDHLAWKPDPELRAQARAEYGIRPDETVIIFAGRFEAQKQPDVLVGSLAQLAQMGRPFRALLAGEGSLRGQVEEGLRASGLLGQVLLLGGVPSEQMPGLLAAGDIFFLPSQNEGISQAIFEAMACGLVVVGADVGGQAELVTPGCGVLIAPAPAGDQSAAYAGVLAHLIDEPALRQQMAQASRERVASEFTLDQMGDCFAALLANMNAAARPGSRPVLNTQLSAQARREARQIVEYLQARQEALRVNAIFADIYSRYVVLVAPKTTSHLFYIWVRQLFFPLYERISQTRLTGLLARLKQAVRRVLVRD